MFFLGEMSSTTLCPDACYLHVCVQIHVKLVAGRAHPRPPVPVNLDKLNGETIWMVFG
jgi:hypothetical protein